MVLLWIKYLSQRISSFRGFLLGLPNTKVQCENQCEVSLLCEVYLFQVDTQELKIHCVNNILDILCDKLSPSHLLFDICISVNPEDNFSILCNLVSVSAQILHPAGVGG